MQCSDLGSCWQCQHCHLECQLLHLIQSLVNDLEEAAELALMLGFLYPCGKHGWSARCQAAAQPSPGHYSHLGSELCLLNKSSRNADWVATGLVEHNISEVKRLRFVVAGAAEAVLFAAGG